MQQNYTCTCLGAREGPALDEIHRADDCNTDDAYRPDGA